jgi:putative ABC transport system permease protein
MKEAYRDQRGLPLLETLWQDIRYGARMLRKNPAFAAMAVLTLALGIGATTAVFSIVNALLIRPLPFREPDRLVWIANDLGGGSSMSAMTTRAGTFVDWKRQNSSFERLGAYFAFFEYGSQTLVGKGDPVRLQGVGVSRDFLETLGVRPQLGRNFSVEECQWNGAKAVILSDALWKRRFGGDPAIVGQTISLRDDLIAAAGGRPQTEPYVVVGVLPSTFDFASIFTPAAKVDFLLPFPICPETDNWGNTLAVIGRLKPGVTLARARSEFKVLDDQIKKAHPERGTDFTAVMAPLKEHISGSYQRPFRILAAAVASVLLIACANLSNLLLARATTRRKEIAVRLALGAGRARLICQMLTESTLLAGLGGLLGLPLAWFTTRMVARTRVFDVPLLSSVGVDGQALGFTLVLAFACGILFGIVPALRLSRSELHDDLKDSGRGSTHGTGHSKVRDSLVVLEVAATCVLLVVAGLLVRSLVSLLEVDPGFRPEQAATWRIQPSRSFANREEQTAWFCALVDTVATLPGVESAGLTDALPLGRNRSWNVRAKGVIYRPGESPEALPRIVDENYLQTMKIPLRSGRLLERDDLTREKRVAVISEALAQRLWPNDTAVGKILMVDGEFEVVGVVGNVRHAGLDRATEPEMYLLGGQNQSGWSTEDLVVRTRASLGTLVPAVRTALRQFDPGMPTGEFRTLGEIIDRSVSPNRLITALMGSFSLLAMLLAAVGIYGVIACSVSQRTSELGIRLALGATAMDIHRLVIGEGMRPVLYGLGLGVITALTLTQVLRALLFGIHAADPLSFATAAMIITLAGLLACWLPARRAAKVDPMVALRYE